MCTVTFIPARDGIYLTSNRDEHATRERAVHPRWYTEGSAELIYPRDATAGGSWIALKRNGDAAVLLNGAFIKHQRMGTYRKSRGLVFLDIVRSACPLTFFGAVGLSDIEPFTLVVFAQGQLFECLWNGAKKHKRQLSATEPHIWSSVTLYDEAACDERRAWFSQWYSPGTVSIESILHFHQRVRLQREKIATVSITSIRISEGRSDLRYLDLGATERPEPASYRGGDRGSWFNRFLIRLTHWEYWPFTLIYLPVFVYWAWLSWKARSFFFFSTSNPSIRNAGFLLESKKDIYDLLPAGSYPSTLFCPLGTEVGARTAGMRQKGLSFPLIGKPDIGQRGLKVKLLQTETELSAYANESKVDFLLQEYIDYPNEIGIFYYRIPGESTGHISGIVGKELLAVTGDGRSTIEELLLKQSRAVLQLPVLRRVYGAFLQKVLAAGLAFTLVPYGNHSRGARFVDRSAEIDPRLEQVVDELCRQVPGFYFGRLDIRFNSWEELRCGKAFSVIELNGAGSEPTHIYDPAHSLFFAWKEITRHLRLLYRISRANARQQGLHYMSTRAGWRMLRDYARHEKLISQ
jgi:hypothetical protein